MLELFTLRVVCCESGLSPEPVLWVELKMCQTGKAWTSICYIVINARKPGDLVRKSLLQVKMDMNSNLRCRNINQASRLDCATVYVHLITITPKTSDGSLLDIGYAVCGVFNGTDCKFHDTCRHRQKKPCSYIK